MSLVASAEVLPDSARVWIYQADRPFREGDVPEIRHYVQQFAQQWVSHNRQLRAFGDVLHNRFVVLMVDESQADASGCSIDKSVYFLKTLQQTYGVDLFDRMRFSYIKEDGQVVTVDRDTFEKAYREGQINGETLVFDTLVATKGDFDRGFAKPLKESWHKRLVN